MTGGDREEVRRRLVHARMLGERFLYRSPGGETGTEPAEAGAIRQAVGGPTEDLAGGGFDAAAWEELRQQVMTCTRCELHRSRTQGVFGSGTPTSRFMVVGEAPGFHEDRQGEAFVGKAGQLLTRILGAIGFSRDEVFITNILKSRPPAGLYHCVNSGHATWKEVGEEIVRRLSASPGLLKPVSVQDVPMRAPRPQFAALSNAKLARAGYVMPPWQDAIGRYLAS